METEQSGRRKPHVVMVVPRGEAVRNFLYSDTLAALSQGARVTLLSVVDDDRLIGRCRPFPEQIIPLRHYPDHPAVSYLHVLVEMVHFRWLWSEVAKNLWEWRDAQATTPTAKAKRLFLKALARAFANEPSIEALTALEQSGRWHLRRTTAFDDLFRTLEPDLVFNCSHIHGPAADLPLEVAHRLGIPTAGFVFSWDNLTSRSRIVVPYDYYLVWHEQMRRDLLRTYRRVRPDHVFVTGTPQFDFHFKPEFCLTREDLCRRIGIDPRRPFVLYTTGIDNHFPEEHRTVELVVRLLREIEVGPRPQLVVRTYVKGTSAEMKALANRGLPDVVFPPVLWDAEWQTPRYEDLALYTSLLRHASLGINAASTVSLELLMHGKPVINLGFNPPGSSLPHHFRWVRHIEFDHYRPVSESGAVMVANAPEEMRALLIRGLTNPQADGDKQRQFIRTVFGGTLDGNAGRRIAQQLVTLAESSRKAAK